MTPRPERRRVPARLARTDLANERRAPHEDFTKDEWVQSEDYDPASSRHPSPEHNILTMTPSSNSKVGLFQRHVKNPPLTAHDWAYPVNTLFNVRATPLP